jgi:RNAse (barnase) inhibitor barstar
MTGFTEDAAHENLLDYVLIRDGGVAMYFAEGILAEAIAWLRDHNWVIHELDCAAWQTELDFHRAASAQLDFPGYYGQNLDAFNDCMRDIVVPSIGGLAVVFRHFDQFARRFPKPAWHILDIVARTTRDKLLLTRRFVTLLQSDDPRLAFEPIGAVSAMWNRKEWMNSKRGL